MVQLLPNISRNNKKALGDTNCSVPLVKSLKELEKEVVLNMIAGLAADTAVVLGYKNKIKHQLEEELRAQPFELECMKNELETAGGRALLSEAAVTCAL